MAGVGVRGQYVFFTAPYSGGLYVISQFGGSPSLVWNPSQPLGQPAVAGDRLLVPVGLRPQPFDLTDLWQGRMSVRSIGPAPLLDPTATYGALQLLDGRLATPRGRATARPTSGSETEPMRPLFVIAAFLVTLSARAEERFAAGARVAAGLARQLAAAKPPVTSIAVVPIRDGPGISPESLRAFSAAVAVGLRRAGLAVRDWYAMRQRRARSSPRDQAGGRAPPPSRTSARSVSGEAAAKDGAALLAMRVVSVPAQAVLATESAKLDRPPATTAAAAPARRAPGRSRGGHPAALGGAP